MDPLMDALAEQAKERAYHLEALVLLQAGSETVKKREAQVKNQYRRTLVERIRMDRVDPREMAEAREAEADLETEAMKAEVDTVENLWNDDPRKGRDLTIARRRRTLEPLDSPLGAEGRRAEPLSRRRTDQDWEKTTLLVKVQWKGI